METQHDNSSFEEMWQKAEKSHQRGKIVGGLLIIAAGVLFLAKELGADIPQWIFTWKMFLIAVGFIIGVKHKFLHPLWLILVVIGGAFIMGDIYPQWNIRPFWPVLVILVGIAILFKPRRSRRHYKWHQKFHEQRGFRYRHECFEHNVSSNEDFVESTTFMGGVKKNILSKKFKGGDITNVFGGAEINFTQADFEGTATLEMVNVFGGTKLIIPANWEITSDVVAVMGSVEDKRTNIPAPSQEKSKVLILKGTCFFGGVDIRNY